FVRNLKWFLLLFVITFGIHSLEFRFEAGWPYLGFSKEGFFIGSVYTARLALLIIFAALLTLTTAPIELTDGVERLLNPLKRFRMPVHEFALMMTLALRFIPILIREAERVKNAHLSRGATLQGSIVSRIRSIIPMAMPLFLSAIRRADELAIAMAARHYTGGEGRTSYQQFVFERADYYLLLSAVSLLLGIVMFQFLNAM
ncbi:energy-coupling factor transporter transmembrane protein EcfT, partial [bacterium]|nr:energy-coupling factor transporter transmembrane protein EcfT [bacterium]